MARRQRTDSVAGALKAFRDAAGVPLWPSDTVDKMALPEDQRRAETIYKQVLESRAPEDWRQHDYTMAAQLAVCEVDLAKVTAQIEATGYTGLGGKGGLTVIKNPLLDVAQFYTNRQIQLARALSLVGAGVDLRQVKNGAKAVASARDARAKGGGHSLLAGYNDDDELFASPGRQQ